MNRIYRYWLVGSRGVIYFFQTWGKDEPWEWLWKRVHNPHSVDFESKPLVWLLLSLAWEEREHLRVLATYRDFEDIIKSSWNDEWRARIVSAIDGAEVATTNSSDAAPSDR